MNRSMRRNETKRLDGLLNLPLDRFRRALTRLSEEELAALADRLDVHQKRHRLARGEFGMARHCAPGALALLARRETALRTERNFRLNAPSKLVQLAPPSQEAMKLDQHLSDELAA